MICSIFVLIRRRESIAASFSDSMAFAREILHTRTRIFASWSSHHGCELAALLTRARTGGRGLWKTCQSLGYGPHARLSTRFLLLGLAPIAIGPGLKFQRGASSEMRTFAPRPAARESACITGQSVRTYAAMSTGRYHERCHRPTSSFCRQERRCGCTNCRRRRGSGKSALLANVMVWTPPTQRHRGAIAWSS